MQPLNFFDLFTSINWVGFIVSVVVVSAIGAIWHSSVLFGEIWKKANKADSKGNSNVHAAIVLILQLITTALIGLMYFVATQISMWLSLLLLVAIAGWEVSDLSFRIRDYKSFLKAVSVGVGYFCVTSLIFIFFATLE